ncbi:hypothetical protein ALC57_14035 [Trachymyrmex cornetzi]|uniref:Uncharacterized protein n=1 Tax=Trachymyrmex cornetzi TaxID=471704 RepID=A0A151IZA1_9HYME|nr:hypothetical protein ALC57_14035 [Trachymyrmex cornetzi]
MRSYGYRALVVLATVLAHMTGTFAGQDKRQASSARSVLSLFLFLSSAFATRPCSPLLPSSTTPSTFIVFARRSLRLLRFAICFFFFFFFFLFLHSSSIVFFCSLSYFFIMYFYFFLFSFFLYFLIILFSSLKLLWHIFVLSSFYSSFYIQYILFRDLTFNLHSLVFFFSFLLMISIYFSYRVDLII